MTGIDTRLDQLRKLRDEILELREDRDASAGVVELDQTRSGRLSRVDSMQRQAIAQHGQQIADERLRRINAAIRRCQDGSYGNCLDCGEPIDERRLDADPSAALCIECARNR